MGKSAIALLDCASKLSRRLGLAMGLCVVASGALGQASEGSLDPFAPGTPWQAIRLGPDAFHAEALPTLTIIEPGRVAGTTGCNRYVGPFEARPDGTLRFGPLAMTRMACGGGRDQNERRFTAALQGAQSFRRDGDQLVILTAGGELRLVRP